VKIRPTSWAYTGHIQNPTQIQI